VQRVQNVLRATNSSKMRTSVGNLVPVTTTGETGGGIRFVAGDARVNEHAVLTSMHTAWLREHNRLCDSMANLTMSEDEKFERAKAV
jgi:peroxidase